MITYIEKIKSCIRRQYQKVTYRSTDDVIRVPPPIRSYLNDCPKCKKEKEDRELIQKLKDNPVLTTTEKIEILKGIQ